MKSYQIVFDDFESFENQLSRIKTETRSMLHSDIFFYLTWTDVSENILNEITGLIEETFPDSVYYGNEASGSIIDGALRFGVAVTCYVLEDNASEVELIWVQKDTECSNLGDLWKYCKTVKNLKAVELLPTMSFLDDLEIDNDIPDIGKDIVIFGGTAITSMEGVYVSKAMAKGHTITDHGMPVILYIGENLNIFADYVLGWKGLGRTMSVTKSFGKTIYEIDNQPAYSIYEKYLGSQEDFADNLVFPLIIEEDGVEFIRTPQITHEDKSLRVFADIEEGTLARIAYGDKNTILESLYDKAVDVAGFKPQVLKSFSCLGRRYFWGDDEIHKETLPFQSIAPVSGFYTGGEIFTFGKKIRVLNQTLVVIGFREGDGASMEVRAVDTSQKVDKSTISRVTHFIEVVAKEQKEALALANEEGLRNDKVHEIIRSCKWSFFVNGDDEITGTSFSESTKKIINLEAPESVAEWKKNIHPKDRDEVLKQLFATIHDHTCSTPYDVTYRMKTPDGTYRWYHSAARAVRDENGNGEVFGIHIDITEQIEAQLRQQQDLERALSQADSANHAKTEFLFNMSHDIRTPMNAILGFTNMAIKHINDEEKTLDCLRKIQQSGDLLLNLINNVLEVSRIESGKAEVNEMPGDVYYSFIDIEDTMKVMAEQKDITLTFEFGNITDRYVLCDYNRCERIFVNIISNAIKYTNAGGIIKVRCEQVENGAKGIGRYKYTFEDNGIGMSKEYQKHVFEQFSRAQNVTKSGIQGTGLGMAVCKSYVEFMGGMIKCESELGEGTTFTVTLPFKLQKECNYVDPYTKELIKGTKKNRNHKAKDFRGKHILVVEDNDLNREITVELLEEQGMAVDEAIDGTDAVRLLSEYGPYHYDIILMDIQMPIMGGYEATREIRKMYPGKKIPIIALSANAFAEDKAASLEVGMDDHVAKPINTDELLGIMGKYI